MLDAYRNTLRTAGNLLDSCMRSMGLSSKDGRRDIDRLVTEGAVGRGIAGAGRLDFGAAAVLEPPGRAARPGRPGHAGRVPLLRPAE